MRGRNMHVGYARVSTLDQDLTIQLEALERAGCHPSNIFQEKASGAEGKRRPVRDEMLAQLERGDQLVVYKIDRLGRSVVDLLAVVRDLDARGVAFKSVTQPIDTSDPAGRLFLTLLAAFAEFERTLILERTAAGQARRKAEGLPHGGPRMFGTVGIGPKAVTEDQALAEAELICEAARRVLGGEPVSRVVEDWNARGVPAVRGDRWRVTALRRVLTNPRVSMIVGDDTARELAALFDNRGNRRQQLGRPAEFLLSGILRCGRDDCGQPLYAASKTGRTGVPQMVYRCKATAGSGGRFAGCGSTTVSLSRADAWAEEMFVAAVAAPEFAEALNQRQAELLAGDATAEELKAWRDELDDLENVPARYAPPNAAERRDQLQRMVREATARLMERPELQALLDLPRSEARLRARWAGWSVAERRDWLRRLVEFVTVRPATAHHRGSAVEDRFAPVWSI